MCARSQTSGDISSECCARSPASSIGSSSASVRARARSSSSAACTRGAVTVVRLPTPLAPPAGGGALGADRAGGAVDGEREWVLRQREEAAVDRLDDLVEVAVLELRGAAAAGEQRVAAEQDRVPLEHEAGRAGGVAGRVDGAQPEV